MAAIVWCALSSCAGAPAPSLPLPSSPASSQPVSVTAYSRITAEKARERMDSGDDVIILDVRTPSEFALEHIPGAILIPNETIGDTRPELLPHLHTEILVYCRSGGRSRQAAEKLLAMGYTAVFDFGGISEWPYETVKE
jgi:phage shock protein E